MHPTLTRIVTGADGSLTGRPDLRADKSTHGRRNRPGYRQPSDAGDVGGEEVDGVAVEVAAGAVVVLGGPWVGVAGQDLGVA